MIGFQIWLKRLEKRDRINLFYLLEQWAEDPQTATRPFLITPADPSKGVPQVETTYAQAYENVLKYAAWLKEEHGVGKGEMVAMDYMNTPKFVWLWFALWSLGAVPAFINHNLRDKAFVHSVRVSTARLLLVDHEVEDLLTEETTAALGEESMGRPLVTVLVTPEVETSILSRDPYRAPDSARAGVKATDVAMLIYTSGTTGLPKAANVNWGKPASGPRVWARLHGLQREDRYFTALPLYHTSGSCLGVLPVLGPGCALVLAPKFSARQYMRQISETDATGMQYIGEMCRYLVSTPPSPYDRAHKLKFAYGNGMRMDVWQKMKDRFNIPTIIEFYGATEGPSAMFTHSRNDFTRGAVGRSGLLTRRLFGGNLLVKHNTATDEPYRDPQTGLCERCATNETGELLHPLDAKAIDEKYFGYVGNEKASMSKVLRDVLAKGDAYYRTGDLQRVDADGRWWFMDRIGDTFRWKSENVSTAEVSEAVGDHPAVVEANCYGVQLPHHDGRAGCAALVLREGATLDEGLGRELAAHARKRLPRYAVPVFLRVMTHVEVTGTHKHQKVALRNEGVDPEKVGEDEVFWLEPGAEGYRRFGGREWKRVVGGEAKL